MPDEQHVAAAQLREALVEAPEVADDLAVQAALARGGDAARAQRRRLPVYAGRGEHVFGDEDLFSLRPLHEQPERALAAQRVSGEVAARQARAPHRGHPMAGAHAAGEGSAARERLQDALHHLGAGEQRVLRRAGVAEHPARGVGHVHAHGAEQARRAPAPQVRADVVLLEDGHVVAPPHGGQRRFQPHRAGADHHDARGHPLRSTAFCACTQCAITPPPRIAAATDTASVISSGLTPASAHPDAYESMQYGSWMA